MSRIWCECLGKKSSNDEDRIKVLDHDFSVVTFAYDYDLGRRGIFDDVKLLLSSSFPLLENFLMRNRKTGKLACSSRNVYGAFHVYHTSCLILWMLSIEFEIVCNQSVSHKVGKRCRRKNGDKSNTAGKDGTVNTFSNSIVSVLCSECQGTGVNIEGDELEKTPASHSEFQMNVYNGYKGWMKSPEILEKCSTGFHFPSESGEPVQSVLE